MAEHQTTRELLEAGLIDNSQVDAAIDAALEAVEFNVGPYTLDLVSAIAANGAAMGYLADPRKGEEFRREVVRGQVMSARPLKGGRKLIQL